MKTAGHIALLISFAALAGCSPEPGSERWCSRMAEKPKSQWSFDDGTTYAKHCIVSDYTIGSELDVAAVRCGQHQFAG